MSLPERTCETCTHYTCEAMGDYGSGPFEVRCRLFDREPDRFKVDPEDDENFPYDPAPDCYELEFWHTDFANDLNGSEEQLNEAYLLFRAYLDQDHPL